MTNNRIVEGFKRFWGLVLIVALLMLLVGILSAQRPSARASISGMSAGAVAVAPHVRAVLPQMSGPGVGGVVARKSAGATRGARDATGQGTSGGSSDSGSELKWLDGSIQTTYDNDCFDGALIPITSEVVGYWGNEDATSPKVGEVFYGRVVVGGVSNGYSCAGPYANIEVLPPAETFLAIDSTNKVHCSVGNFRDPEFTELPESQCPQSTWKGTYGWVLNQPTGLPWDVTGGKMIIIAFPLISTRTMSGAATNSWLTVGVHAFDGWLSPWDTPKQSLFVADNPPSIQYEAGVTTSGNNTKTSATLFNHYKAGKAYFDIGTTTKYDTVSDPIQIRNKADAYHLYELWQGLEPGLTYHWRLRFVTAAGKTYVGGDQSFVAQHGQPTPYPKPSATSKPQSTPGPNSTPHNTSTPTTTSGGG